MFLVFLAFVVLLSGFVAYAADVIARRTGRRHLRLFGLRPKTTALIVAVASGMAISFFSVLAFGLLNRQALRNIAQADQLRSQLIDLNRQRAALERTVEQTRSQLESARGEANALKGERERAVLERDAAQRARGEAEAGLGAALLARDAAEKAVQVSTGARDAALLARDAASVQRDRAVAQRDQAAGAARASQQAREEALAQRDAAARETAALQAKLTDLNARRDELARKAAAAEGALKGARARLAALTSQVRDLEAVRADLGQKAAAAQQAKQSADALAQSARNDADTLFAQQKTLQTQLKGLQTQAQQLKQQNQTLSGARDQLRRERDQAQREAKAQQAVRDALVQQNDVLRQGLQSAQADKARLAGDVARVTTELSATKAGDLLYEKGALVGTQVVASVLNVPDAVAGARAKALLRGAKGNPPADISQVDLEKLRADVRALNSSALVVFRSKTNAVQGFPVTLMAEAFPNKLLYRRDEVIRAGRIAGGGFDQMREQLLGLVTDAVIDLQRRGVPPENIQNGGLSQAETLSFLNALQGKSGVQIGVASKTDVRPGNAVDLYPVLVK